MEESLNEGEGNKGGMDSGSDWHVREVLFCYQLLKVCQRPHCTLEPLSGLRCVCVCVLCVCACYSVVVRAFLKMYQKCSKTGF